MGGVDTHPAAEPRHVPHDHPDRAPPRLPLPAAAMTVATWAPCPRARRDEVHRVGTPGALGHVLLVASGERVALPGSADGYSPGSRLGPGGPATATSSTAPSSPTPPRAPNPTACTDRPRWWMWPRTAGVTTHSGPCRCGTWCSTNCTSARSPPAGTFAAAVAELDDLVELGVTAVEIMPVAQFPGRRNWGYDGVFPFAVQNTYGGPAGLQAFVDECHRRGLARGPRRRVQPPRARRERPRPPSAPT